MIRAGGNMTKYLKSVLLSVFFGLEVGIAYSTNSPISVGCASGLFCLWVTSLVGE